ncbi:hypothetical protein SGRA_2221 [Saprospira grandis str. Lewin]|uniref:Uncharacterized protein n=1 Tax=Saprospira grandis (strain Lewin) TaxID=984262 RepID=H6L3K2_SAPGL|nr:hypothetical protein SGRA_2221 [Saprospira grandis str. Lewin]
MGPLYWSRTTEGSGLAMVGSAAKPQTKQKLVFCAGPSEQRAAERSADERSEAEAQKQQRALKRQQGL